MGYYTLDNFEMLVNLIIDQLGFNDEFLHKEIVEFTQGEIPIMRVMYVEATGGIAICFHAELAKTDAFGIIRFITEKLPKVTIGDEYIVNDQGQTIVGLEAHIEMHRQYEQRYTKEVITEEIVYEPEGEVTFSVPYVTYHAQDPRALEIKKQLDEQMRWYGKFKWDD
tara:strand:- start:58237 stop:58737 length:501 start_codon:yes stop_codon:yes gene_type:complete